MTPCPVTTPHRCQLGRHRNPVAFLAADPSHATPRQKLAGGLLLLAGLLALCVDWGRL